MLLPMLKPSQITFRPLMFPLALSFAVMNGLFILAQALGSAANAILLQYTAPMWMYLVCVGFLGEPADRRGARALVVGLIGILAIIVGGWQGGQIPVILIGLGSGLTFAGVMIGLRLLRDLSPVWLTVWNFLAGALALLPLVWSDPLPTSWQLMVLILFGGAQLGLPYWLVARGLRRVSPPEAGTLTLLEPLLNPLWVYLVVPGGEELNWGTLLGGSCILGALAYRYWPWARPDPLPPPDNSELAPGYASDSTPSVPETLPPTRP